MEFRTKTPRSKWVQTAQAKGRVTSGVKVVSTMKKSQGRVITELAGSFHVRAGVLAYAKNLYQIGRASCRERV